MSIICNNTAPDRLIFQEISSPWDVCTARLPDLHGKAEVTPVLLIAMAGIHQIWALFLQDGVDFTGW
jgi:hypothetical protein